MIEYSNDTSRINIDTVWNLLRRTYWSPDVRREVVERAISNSVVVGAFVRGSGEQVGFARAVTDRATFAWLCDVIVVDQWRRKGIASAMVQNLIAHPDLQTLRRWCLATKDAHSVYARFGFAAIPADRWMEHKLDPSAWAEPGR
ncbi:MAG: GNAT family N-acetyltransferase [Phycisphaerales bacterium]